MKNEKKTDQDWEQEENSQQNGPRRVERKLMLEEEIKKVAEDDIYQARELVMLRKEVNRLHYKVKTYHKQTRLASGIAQLVIIILLLVIIFKLFVTDLPVVPAAH